MNIRMTTAEWAAELGRHVRDLRLRRNIDQRKLARQAGVALNAVKKSGREIPLDTGKGEFERLMQRALSVENQVESGELQEELLAAIAKLPPRQRAAIVQRYYLEMNENEMAQTLKAPAGTVKWLLNNARSRLQVLLGSERSAK